MDMYADGNADGFPQTRKTARKPVKIVMSERLALAERLKALNERFTSVATDFCLDTPVTAKKVISCVV